MEQRPATSSRPPIWIVVAIAVTGLASFGALAGMAMVAWEKFQTGRGWETYRTHWLVEFNWVGFLVLLGAIAVALCIALVLRLREWHEIRQLQRKYGQRASK